MSPREMEGVRVLEYGPWLNVCYAGKLLADLGAEVIRIESPCADDTVRTFGPFPADDPHPEASGLHIFLNSNKRGVTLHPSASPTSQGLFKDLCAWADVLIECTGPGELEGIGLGYASLQQANPRLVMISLSSLGRSGPYGGFKGGDLISWHGSGTGHVYLGDPDREPVNGAWYHASHWGGFNVAVAAAIGLLAREKIGRGQGVDLSEAEALAELFLAVEVSDFYQNDVTRQRVGTVGLKNHAPRIISACKGGWVAVQAISEPQWNALMRVMGNPEWAQNDLFKGTSLDRGRYADEIDSLMEDWYMSHTPQELFRMCQAQQVPTSPLHTVKDLYEDGHLKQRGYFVEMDHPIVGRIRVPGAPWKISGDPWRIDRPAPLLGQHNEEVYCGVLGRPKSDLADLRRGGVI